MRESKEKRDSFLFHVVYETKSIILTHITTVPSAIYITFSTAVAFPAHSGAGFCVGG